ncbi:transcriptional antiterminator, BglG family [Raineyella antarctica]|uniref:Transcriptional antiterminator, BglG family n=1 Tax=Raineyella antarctica TaxID=1577474 RepID=A0A1G6ILM8_9ACTN|nr:PRD domain-containing protein [Raineyella antarctica]SDC07353.1 transcriptional antiterminator, BglG family [Raineyella antarctica]
MDILRVLNNNVVLARDPSEGEVILVGRGLGFQVRPGQPVDPKKVVRRFVPDDGRDPDHLAMLLADVPPEYIQLITTAMAEAGLGGKPAGTTTLVIALADHIRFAVKRMEVGQHVEYPLLAEVQNLYAAEYAQGLAVLHAVNAHLEDPLPDSEAVALTLHLVNAGFSTGDLSYTYTMTGIIQQMLDVIASSYEMDLDGSSVNVGRFITHLRYLFVRIHDHNQLTERHSEIGAAIRQAYPDALQCADKLAAIIELRLGSPVTDDELSYLTLHVARVANE